MARLAEQSERYEDMVEYMKRVACMDKELDLDERNLLSVAYKHAVGARRQAWRAICGFEQSEAGANPAVLQATQGYRGTVEKELTGKCRDVLGLISDQLLPRVTVVEAKVFYLKMQGDYHRYLAEFTVDEAHAKATQEAHRSYDEAMKCAESTLPPTHSIRLGLALNFSVFYFEVLRDRERASALAASARKQALDNMDPNEDNSDSAQILSLLRDNLELWTMEDGKAPQDGTAVEDL